jgi:hypothetical protein
MSKICSYKESCKANLMKTDSAKDNLVKLSSVFEDFSFQ